MNARIIAFVAFPIACFSLKACFVFKLKYLDILLEKHNTRAPVGKVFSPNRKKHYKFIVGFSFSFISGIFKFLQIRIERKTIALV